MNSKKIKRITNSKTFFNVLSKSRTIEMKKTVRLRII